MTIRDWFVDETGACQSRPAQRDWDLIRERYYLHQFLSEIIELIGQARDEKDEWDFLPQIRMRVRQLVTNSYYVQTQFAPSDPKTGVGILTLYDEIGYPLTIQNVTFAPGTLSPIHNHGGWGVVAILKGQERHRFWRRLTDPSQQIELVGEKLLGPGDLISFAPAAIHQVEAVGAEPAVTFHLYGDLQPRSRFEFEPLTGIARPF